MYPSARAAVACRFTPFLSQGGIKCLCSRQAESASPMPLLQSPVFFWWTDVSEHSVKSRVIADLQHGRIHKGALTDSKLHIAAVTDGPAAPNVLRPWLRSRKRQRGQSVSRPAHYPASWQPPGAEKGFLLLRHQKTSFRQTRKPEVSGNCQLRINSNRRKRIKSQ